MSNSENHGEGTFWRSVKGNSPVIATAIHDGHDLRDEVAEILHLSERDRLREEDPYTSSWVDVAETRIVALRSRFEVDLNRPRDKAVYVKPDDCWGLDVWRTEPSLEIINRSLDEYDAYYSLIRGLLTDTEKKFGRFIVFDIHSYNHKRNGPDASPESAADNPEVNIGTGTLDRKKWGPLIDRFIDDLRSFNFMGRRLDVRENIKFKGGNQVKWIHDNFPDTGCGLAIEFKKFWMDEWTGEKDVEQIAAIRQALSGAVPGVLEELRRT
ncbi:MAG: N-formylglutamate amidohydrolase [Pyrinomonadaceae bacterium]